MRSPTLRRRAALGVGCAQLLSPPAAWPATPDIASPKRCLVAGASGRTGALVLEQLALAEYAAVAEIRSDASKSRLPRGIDTLTFDLTDEATAFPDLAGITDVIDAAGFKPTMIPEQDRALARAVDYDGTLRLIAAAERARLPGRFVLVSSLGVNATSASAKMLDESLGDVLKQKYKAEVALRRSRLDWCIVRPGLLLKEKTQGGVLIGPADRWVGDAERDRAGLGGPVKCSSPFLASSGAVCAATRAQVASVCVAALGAPRFSRRIVEVVARPDVPVDGAFVEVP